MGTEVTPKGTGNPHKLKLPKAPQAESSGGWWILILPALLFTGQAYYPDIKDGVYTYFHPYHVGQCLLTRYAIASNSQYTADRSNGRRLIKVRSVSKWGDYKFYVFATDWNNVRRVEDCVDIPIGNGKVDTICDTKLAIPALWAITATLYDDDYDRLKQADRYKPIDCPMYEPEDGPLIEYPDEPDHD